MGKALTRLKDYFSGSDLNARYDLLIDYHDSRGSSEGRSTAETLENQSISYTLFGQTIPTVTEVAGLVLAFGYKNPAYFLFGAAIGEAMRAQMRDVATKHVTLGESMQHLGKSGVVTSECGSAMLEKRVL